MFSVLPFSPKSKSNKLSYIWGKGVYGNVDWIFSSGCARRTLTPGQETAPANIKGDAYGGNIFCLLLLSPFLGSAYVGLLTCLVHI